MAHSESGLEAKRRSEQQQQYEVKRKQFYEQVEVTIEQLRKQYGSPDITDKGLMSYELGRLLDGEVMVFAGCIKDAVAVDDGI